MLMPAPDSGRDLYLLRGRVGTDKNKHVCKVCNWNRVVDILMTF